MSGKVILEKIRLTEALAVKRYANLRVRNGDSCFIPNVTHKGSQVDLLHITESMQDCEYEFKITGTGIIYDLSKCLRNKGGRKHKRNLSGERVNKFTYVIPVEQKASRGVGMIPKEYGIVFIETIARQVRFIQHREACLLHDKPIQASEIRTLIGLIGERFASKLPCAPRY